MSEEPNLLQQLGITPQEIKLRKAFVQFTPRDEEILASLKPLVEPEVDNLVEEFYALILRYEEMRELIRPAGTLERLKAAQKEYLLTLFAGTYDEAYFVRRLAIGATHYKMGLGLRWYQGAYRLYRGLLRALVVKERRFEGEQLLEVLAAIDKITTLDMGLAIDAYVFKYTEGLRRQAKDLTFYRDICRSAKVAIITTGLDGSISEVNPAFEALTGFTQAEARGNPLQFLKSDYVTAKITRDITETVTNNGAWEGELNLKKKGGQLWNAHLTISAVKSESGIPLGYVLLVQDITEMKRALEIVQTYNLEIEKSEKELKEARLETTYRLAVACEARDECTGNHVLRVQHYTAALARQLGFPESQAEDMGLASILHDVGKVHIPDAILFKPDKLTPEEWVIMKTHTIHGERILGAKPYFKMAREIARCHHENYDGSGYPDGLAGDVIPIHARIAKAVDVFDALCDKRPYKEPWSPRRSFEMVKLLKGRELDPTVEGTFESLYQSGEIERIAEQFPHPGFTRAE